MAEYKIKVVTSSDVSGITKTIDAINKLTAATKENAKSAKESASAFNDALKARNNIADQSGYLSSLSKEAKATADLGDETAKTTSKKSQFLAGIKNLGREIPVLGYALSALKNPFTAVGIAAVLAKTAVDNYVESVEKMAETVRNSTSGEGRIQKFFEVLDEGRIGAQDFADKLNRVNDSAKATATSLKAVMDQIERQFKMEEEAAPENESPQAKATRQHRKGAAQVTALGNAARREGARSEELAAAVPAARAKEIQKAVAFRTLQRSTADQEADDAAAMALLLEQEKTIRGDLGTDDATLQVKAVMTGKSISDVRGGLQARLDENIMARNRIEGSRSFRAKDLGRAEAEARRAREARETLEQGAIAAKQSSVDLSQQFRAAADTPTPGYVPPQTMGPGSLQFRRDAQFSAFAARQQQADAAAAVNALKEVFSAIVKLSQDTGRALANQSQNTQ